MRRVHLGDLIVGACLIAGTSPSAQSALTARLIVEADAAHRYMKRFGRQHPNWGQGSIAARAALMGQAPRRDLGDAGFLAALALLCKTLAMRKAALALPRTRTM